MKSFRFFIVQRPFHAKRFNPQKDATHTQNFTFWQRWLFTLSVLVAVFGLALALLNHTPLFEPLNRQVDPVFWAAASLPSAAVGFRSWVYGLLGATMAGWGITLAFLASYAFARREKWAWNAIAIGLLAWYVVDTTISTVFHVYFNVLFNSLILTGGVLPLLYTRRDFGS